MADEKRELRMPLRHLARIPIDEAVVHHILRLPKHMRVVALDYSHSSRSMQVIVESERIPPTALGYELPIICPLYCAHPDGSVTLESITNADGMLSLL